MFVNSHSCLSPRSDPEAEVSSARQSWTLSRTPLTPSRRSSLPTWSASSRPSSGLRFVHIVRRGILRPGNSLALPRQVFVLEGILGLLNAQRDLTGGLGGEVANIEADLGQFAGHPLTVPCPAFRREIQTCPEFDLQASRSSSANWSRRTRASTAPDGVSWRRRHLCS